MKTRILFLTMIILMLMAPLTANAFDGERKGFMLNLGLGFGQGKVSWTGGSLDGTGFGPDLKIGGGPSNQVLVYYTNRVLWWEPEGYSQKLVTGMSAVGVSYFLQPQAPSFFFSGALGLGVFTNSDFDDPDSGIGFTIGVGFEFSRNYIIEFTFMHAGLDMDSGWDPAISNLFFGISWCGY